MKMRTVKLTLFGMLALALGAGCEKSEPGQKPAGQKPASVPAAPPPPPGETIARVHWLGKKRLAGENSATNFMSIWNLPVSARLESQTLDKLALAPWRPVGSPWTTNTAEMVATNRPAAQLRPLLDDLVSEESFLEVRQLTNQTGELAFAIHLSNERAGLWETNLAAVLESLTNARPVATTGAQRGWSLKRTQSPKLIELTRVGEWTLLGLAQERNGALAEMQARIQRERVPALPSASNYWVEAKFDLRKVAMAFSLGWDIPAAWPEILLTLHGDGEHVLTRAKLDFAKPLPFELEPWSIPTNLIHDPLFGFTAVRGVSEWLFSLKLWQTLQLGTPPKQLYVWASAGAPVQTYFAAAVSNAAKPLGEINSHLLSEGNPWLATNGMGLFQSSNGVTGWVGIPFATPHLQVLTNQDAEYLFGGFFPLEVSTNPLPVELYYAVTNLPNLALYDWEYTAARVDGWIFLGQTLRLILGKPQLPIGSAGLTWLQVAGTNFGNCASRLTRTANNQLAFARSSNVGLSAFELHLLADWLESPDFPSGLHSLNVPLERFPKPDDSETAPPPAEKKTP